MEGPFGAASEEIFEFNHVLLVAAGIGVTPFASILRVRPLYRTKTNSNYNTTAYAPFHVQSIRCAYDDPTVDRSQVRVPQKVYFIWINRDRTAFEWFQDVLQGAFKLCVCVCVSVCLCCVSLPEQSWSG